MTPRFSDERRFVGILGLAALVDRLDRIDLVWAWTDHDRFRVPVHPPGIAFPTPVIPPILAVAIIGLGLAAATAMILGVRVRSAAAALVAVSLVDLVVDQQGYSNHTFLIAALAALSVGFPRTDPAALAITVRAQTSSVYLFAALSKLRPGWWSGDVLMMSAQSPLGVRMVRDLPIRTLAVIAVFTVITELVLAAALWARSLRLLSITVGLVFHASIVAVLGWDLGFVAFGLAMLAHLALPLADGRWSAQRTAGIPHPVAGDR